MLAALIAILAERATGSSDRRPYGGRNPAGTFGAHWGTPEVGMGGSSRLGTPTRTTTGFSQPLTYGGGSFGGVISLEGAYTPYVVTPGQRETSPTGSQLSGSGTPPNDYGGDQPVDPGSSKRQRSGHAYRI